MVLLKLCTIMSFVHIFCSIVILNRSIIESYVHAGILFLNALSSIPDARINSLDNAIDLFLSNMIGVLSNSFL